MIPDSSSKLTGSVDYGPILTGILDSMYFL